MKEPVFPVQAPLILGNPQTEDVVSQSYSPPKTR